MGREANLSSYIGAVRAVAIAVCIVIALFSALTMWPVLSVAEAARIPIKSPPFIGLVKISPCNADRGGTDSQYIFSAVTPVYHIENSYDDMKISVGLIGLPNEKRPHWFLSIDSESGVGDLVCHKGGKIWPPGMKEYDEETYLGAWGPGWPPDSTS
jgi:hypothetical protein